MYIAVCDLYIHVYSMYIQSIYNEYVMFIYLYSTACLYNKSSEGVNRFCCSWAESHPPKPQHATYCCHGRQQEREDSWAMNAACRNQLPPGSPSLRETCWWPPLYLQHLAWHKKITMTIFWTGTASIHIVQRSRGQRDVPLSCICISLSTTKACWDNCLYHVHTLYIHCTYMVHTLTYYVHVHWLFNMYHWGNFHCELACNSFMIGLDSAYRQESANQYIHGLSGSVVA